MLGSLLSPWFVPIWRITFRIRAVFRFLRAPWIPSMPTAQTLEKFEYLWHLTSMPNYIGIQIYRQGLFCADAVGFNPAVQVVDVESPGAGIVAGRDVGQLPAFEDR